MCEVVKLLCLWAIPAKKGKFICHGVNVILPSSFMATSKLLALVELDLF